MLEQIVFVGTCYKHIRIQYTREVDMQCLRLWCTSPEEVAGNSRNSPYATSIDAPLILVCKPGISREKGIRTITNILLVGSYVIISILSS